MRLYVMVLFSLIIATTGCSEANEGSSSPGNQQQVQVQQTSPPKQEITNSTEVVERLEKLAESVPHVIRAHCVVMGNTAIVGIDVDGKLERARVGTIKYSVAEALRKDPIGIHAIVTADIDIGNRLREMNTDIKNGKPIQWFYTRISRHLWSYYPTASKRY